MYYKMNEMYSNIDNPTGLASIDTQYREIKKINEKVSKNDVKLFLFGQDFYTMYKVLPKKISMTQISIYKTWTHTCA